MATAASAARRDLPMLELFVPYMGNQPTASSRCTDIKSRIEAHKARVGIIGLGYVGLPLALLYSEQKFPVTGFDIDARKVSILDQGGSDTFRIPTTAYQAAN